MFYNNVVKITRCNKLDLLFDLVKCISAKLLEASKFADLLPTSFRFSSANFCQPDFLLIQRPGPPGSLNCTRPISPSTHPGWPVPSNVVHGSTNLIWRYGKSEFEFIHAMHNA